jgi:EAL domain-containing protein (putative c-di-GMP-specific phosphodiesterase class I)/GAF domain-containing protein
MSSRSEEDRLAALRELELLDTAGSESFDRITRMAARVFASSAAAVSLTDRDRQWCKSAVGLTLREYPRKHAPCAEVCGTARVLMVPDLQLDPRFADGHLARAGWHFYAGAPLVTQDGVTLGAMCVLDQTPRMLAADQLKGLEDFAAMVMSQIELQHAFGRIDPLSGLPNRQQMAEDLADLARRQPQGHYTTLLIDLTDGQHFDRTVSVLGTLYIDALVRASSRAIREVLRREIRLYHVGIAAYAAVLDDAAGPPWREVVASLNARLREPVWCNGIPVAISAVYGTSAFRPGETAAADVLRTAISAAQDARHAEAGCASYNVANDEANRRRFTLLSDIRAALGARDQLSLVYQPRLELRTMKCVGVEALLRWKHPTLGGVPPGEFIPLAEQTALAHAITAWVLETALRQAALWQRAGRELRVSVNVSAPNLEEPGFARSVGEALARHRLTPSALEVEFTESALIRNSTMVRSQLSQIRDMGVAVAIDDFGTGYSTFSYLKQLPANTVKIDQSFIRGLSVSARERMLLRSMVGMSHELGYRVVAEGVETEEDLDFLVTTLCDEAQGYYISRPVPAPELERWLRNTETSTATPVAQGPARP